MCVHFFLLVPPVFDSCLYKPRCTTLPTGPAQVYTVTQHHQYRIEEDKKDELRLKRQRAELSGEVTCRLLYTYAHDTPQRHIPGTSFACTTDPRLSHIICRRKSMTTKNYRKRTRNGSVWGHGQIINNVLEKCWPLRLWLWCMLCAWG